ncbi:MAG TPA: UdgX family uracil-DNA binding protein [Candidatus Limnocylindrales bacterium]|nr:UdgX family uracil-DNA binding protein [Candidatus Limnocylindrales bacterium]
MAPAERAVSRHGRPVRRDPARRPLNGARAQRRRHCATTTTLAQRRRNAPAHPTVAIGRRRHQARDMTEATPAHPADVVPPDAGLPSARNAAFGCQACELWERATQTVFGEGRETAQLVLVGEQPGDHEDRQGHVFVGPAGRVLDEALEAAGIDREAVFVTNVVKHFRWRPSGKRRLHERPNAGHIRACRPWLDLEIVIVRPKVVVALGATAAQALIGPAFRITEGRGVLIEPATTGGPRLLATIHPSAVLRQRSSEEREASRRLLAEDLALAARAARTAPRRRRATRTTRTTRAG